jgi:hypothetical protein
MGITGIYAGFTKSLVDYDPKARVNVVNLLVGCGWFLAILCIALWVVSAFREGPYMMANDHRLAPSLGIINGYKLYSPQTGGPILSTIYGPFTALAYLPAALIKAPVWAIYTGVAFSLCFFFVPAALLLRQLTMPMGLSTAAYAATLLSFALLAQAVPSIGVSATMIHADAPAIGAAGLSCCFLMREQYKFWSFENLVLAGVFAGISIFSKQSMAPFVVTAAVWLTIRAGVVALSWFLGAVGGVAVTSIFLLKRWLGDATSIFFNIVTIPAHQPYLKIKLFEAFHDLQFQALIFLLLPLMLSGWRIARRVPGEHRRPEWLLMSSAIALSVTSVLGEIKLGGNVNALSPASYFSLLAFSCSLSTLTPPKSTASAVAQPACLAMAMLAVLFGPIFLMEAASSFRHNLGQSLLEQAYRFDRQHPREVYFPEYPFAVLAAEGRLYNFAWGLEDRAIAGFKVSPERFIRFIPDTDIAAVEENVPFMESQFLAMCHDDPSLRPIPGLTGFKLCRIDRPGRPPALGQQAKVPRNPMNSAIR